MFGEDEHVGDALLDEISSLRAENQDLQNQLYSKDVEIENLQNIIERLEIENSRLQDDVYNWRDQANNNRDY